MALAVQIPDSGFLKHGIPTLMSDDYFDDLRSAFEDYKKELKADEGAAKQIAEAFNRIDDTINDLNSDRPVEPDDSGYYGSNMRDRYEGSERSIFYDVDD